MRWHTFLMGAAANEKLSTAIHSHAVDLATWKPICGRVKIKSLVIDTSLCKPGELPTCPQCLKKLQTLNYAGRN